MSSDIPWIPRALHALEAALQGRSAALEFKASEPNESPSWVERPDTACMGAAVVVRTSGSTGTPKQTLLSAECLRASAHMTARYFAGRGWGGHGQWLLTLHPSYVAGLAVLTRSLFADTQPIPLLKKTTDPEAFAAAAEQMSARHRYVSLVPTQLTRLLGHAVEHGNARLLAALRRFDAILLGGGASSAELIASAESAGLHVVRTYGMSETSGGCVYDGVPLPGAGAKVDDDGRVLISGPQVALGYLDAALTAERFDADSAGTRRFHTDDLGVLTDGVLRITGRGDDVINTGGVKISAEQIRQVLEADPEVREAFVTGIRDPEWGQQVAAVIALQHWPEGEYAPLPHEGTPADLPEYPPHDWFKALDATVRQKLGAAAVPKNIQYRRNLPRLANGKPDRQEMIRMLTPKEDCCGHAE